MSETIERKFIPHLPDDEEQPAQLPEPVNRREFLRRAAAIGSAALAGSHFPEKVQAEHDDEVDEAAIEWLNTSTLIGGLDLNAELKERADPLPRGIHSYLVQFERDLRHDVQNARTPEGRAALVRDVSEFALYVNRGTAQEGKHAFRESLQTKSSAALIADLTVWARDREARKRIQNDVLSPHYEVVVRRRLQGGDHEAAAEIIRSIILKNISKAYSKDASRSHVAYLRAELVRYEFPTPLDNDTGNLELWVPLAKHLSRERERWENLLSLIERGGKVERGNGN